MLQDLELMQIQSIVLFGHDAMGRLTKVNDHSDGDAPRLFIGRTQEGNIVRYHAQLRQSTIHEIARIVNKTDPFNLAEIMNALATDGQISRVWIGPAYVFPENLPDPIGAIQMTEVNRHLLKSGFPDVFGYFHRRQPCFGVVEDGIAVSVCSSARQSTFAAEASLETLPNFRGKGFATNVANAWAQEIQKQGRIPLYSTYWDNFSSQAVAKKLNLKLYGMDFHIR